MHRRSMVCSVLHRYNYIATRRAIGAPQQRPVGIKNQLTLFLIRKLDESAAE
jgi:hypothetical protein